MLYSDKWIGAGYAVFCRMDMIWLCCILQNGYDLVMLYSAV